MNPDQKTKATNGHAPAPGMGVDDILFTLFRHKFLILGFCCLGLVAAGVLRFIKPPFYESKAKVMVHFVENRTVSQADDGAQIISAESGGESLLNTEVEILRSIDVATNVAQKIGPARILAKRGGGDDLMAAAGVIGAGVEVLIPPRTAILTISFKNRDRDLVQPVLGALIDAYKLKHNQVHGGDHEAYYASQREELGEKLRKTEEAFKDIKAKVGLVSLEETKHDLQTQISRWQDELLTARGELAEKTAFIGNAPRDAGTAAGSDTGVEARVPQEKVDDYSLIIRDLESLKKQERENSLKYRDAYPIVKTIKDQIQNLKQQKAALESKFPSLMNFAAGMSRGGTNSASGEMVDDLAEVRRLTARVITRQEILSNLLAQATVVMDLEPKMTQLQRERDLQETNYNRFSLALQQAQVAKSLGPDNMINMDIVQKPTPPVVDTKKLMKLVGAAFGGCVAMGLALAFLIDLVLDRSIKRAVDIERHLHLPIFLTIPDEGWTGGARLPWGRTNGLKGGLPATNGDHAEDAHEGTMAVGRWNPQQCLEPYISGLRERLITHFEINSPGLKQPKLVGVTSCGEGAGVSTLAAGLAASLSKTGEGNVLLVDMCREQGGAHSYFNGQPGCGPMEELHAGYQERVAQAGDEQSNQLIKAPLNGFGHLVPNLKTSNYDYIVFDLPPVSQTSPTPRHASHMDIVLLVLEAEKTGQQMAARASTLMRDARSNVVTVLNKYRAYVPARLSQEM